MRSLTRVVVTFALVQSVASAVAWACTCEAIDDPPEALLDANDRVFVGDVVAGPRGGGGCGGAVGSADPVTYTLEVTEAFKGVEVGDEVELTTARDGDSCGASFEVGESWLIYTNTDSYGLCSPGGRAEHHAADLEALRAAAE